ncbi:MAG: ribosome assembly factor SBDS [Thermoprotei archaeon]|nr:MAG: ribosome assembly factor SBDS [Thermoprotei archaeon]RLF24395.1 MAG: ribosome assembly factor SBDS [Thermoprotei archaeon]
MERGKYVIARYSSHGERFEIIVEPEAAWRFREGKEKDLRKVLVYDVIYKDAKKGLRASEETLMKVFGTTDPYKVAEQILRKGEIQLTAEQRRRMIEAKRRQIIEFISRNCIDPRTGHPHPPSRIESALEEAKVGIDPFKPAEEQAMNIIKALQRILPIKIARALIAVKIPAAYVGRAYGVLSRMGTITRQAWLPDGSWMAELEIPAGMRPILIEKVNQLTKGEGEIRILSMR